MLTGLISALVLVAVSPNVLNPEAGVAILVGDPIFTLTNPAIVSIPLGFIGGYVGTVISNARDAKKYAEVMVKANTGVK
jgi:cation/acetate symporter